MSNQWNQPPYDGRAGGQPYGQQPQQPYPSQYGQPEMSPYASMAQNDTSVGGVASGVYVFASCVLPLLILGGVMVVAFVIGFGVIAASDDESTPTSTSTSVTTTRSF